MLIGISKLGKGNTVGSMGLRNMKERLESHEGAFSAVNAKGSGLTLSFHLPGTGNQGDLQAQAAA